LLRSTDWLSSCKRLYEDLWPLVATGSLRRGGASRHPRLSGLYFAGREPANCAARSTHFSSCAPASPSGSTKTQAFIARPVRSNTRVCGSANGGIRWHKRWVNISQTLGEELIGLVEIDDGEWDVYFGPLRLGRLHERTLCIEDALGRQYRRRY